MYKWVNRYRLFTPPIKGPRKDHKTIKRLFRDWSNCFRKMGMSTEVGDAYIYREQMTFTGLSKSFLIIGGANIAQ